MRVLNNYEKYYHKRVKDTDTVVLTGDHSWGRNLSEYEKDLCFLHYPPTSIGEEASPFTEMAENYGAEKVIYSHCHGKERYQDSFQGYVNGIEYKLVSSDYLRFKPELIIK